MISRRCCTIALVVLGLFLITAITVGAVIRFKGSKSDEKENRIFTVDHVNNTFIMNGKPFQYVSGSFHYFRALPETWKSRLTTMRAAGLNAVDTYVEWSLHNPKDGVYKWDGISDLEKFIQLASDLGFYVVLRPGPYICAERDNGGLPYWLFSKYPNIKPRTNDADYTKEVEIWYSKLFPRLQRFLYGNGGSIIMVQVENEYSSFAACDHEYGAWLRDETQKYIENRAVLFTTDIPNDRMNCGKIEGVLATTDFGFEKVSQFDRIWQTLRKVQPTGPLVNSEFYPGWLTHWQEQNARRDGQEVAKSLKVLLEQGANVNIYMFFGGTNFGFTSGANGDADNSYLSDITSYDYDAPMDESGGVTPKYELIRQVILEHFKPTNLPSIPQPAKRISYGEVELKPIAKILSSGARSILSTGLVTSPEPKTFEKLDQYSGLLLYETQLPKFEIDPTLLTVQKLRDRAMVLIDGRLIGVLSRGSNIYSIPLSSGIGDKLQILVENQGRINFNMADDIKGILGTVSVQNYKGGQNELKNWEIYKFPLEEANIVDLLSAYKLGNLPEIVEDTLTPILTQGPVIYHGEFIANEIGDTYLNTIGWGKGVAFINGMNLGRYWPLGGPQLTLYAPNEILKNGINTLVLVEYQRANRVQGSQFIRASFDREPQLDG